MALSRVHRLLRLLTILQSGKPCGPKELMEELGVSRRTLFRDLAMLQEAGIPCYHDPAFGYRIRKSFFMPPISLSVTETLGLMALAKASASQRDKPMIGPALSAVYKLIATAPEPVRSACGELMAHVSVDPGAQVHADEENRFYTVLQQAIDEQRACRINYRAPADAEGLQCVLEPYLLHFANNAWYVFGRTDAHDEVRVLKLARFKRIQPLGRFFDRPARFDVADKLGNAWRLNPEGVEYDIELEFTPKVGTNVAEVRWHATQEHELREDGSCRMWFTVDGLSEIAWWLCGYANQVRVVKPEALRERITRMHRDAAGQYG